MLGTLVRSTLFAVALLAARRAPRPVPTPPPPAPDRVVLLSAGDPEYAALPAALKSAPEASLHLVVYREGVCVRDLGLVDEKQASSGQAIVEEKGTVQRAFVSEDGRA